MAQAGQRSRLKSRYEEEIRPALIERFKYSTPMQAPAISKITLNMGVGDAKQDSKVLEAATEQLATIAGQRPSVRRARKSIAAFKLREGMPVGVSVTLRGERSYEFLDRLMSVAIPRIRDFRGMNPRSFDGRGNYSLGVREQIIFPEIDYDAIDQTRGLDITITTSAKTDAEAFALLEAFGFPFARPEGAPPVNAGLAAQPALAEEPEAALEEAIEAAVVQDALDEGETPEQAGAFDHEAASTPDAEQRDDAEPAAARQTAQEPVPDPGAREDASQAQALRADAIIEEAAEELLADAVVEEAAAEVLEDAVEEALEDAVDKALAEALVVEAAEEVVDAAAEEVAQEAKDEEIAEDLAAQALVEEIAEVLDEGVAEELVAQALADEVAEELVAEEVVAVELAEALVVEELAEELVAEGVAEEVAEELAEELVAEELAEELVAQALAEEVAEELVAEGVAEEIAEEVAEELVAEGVAEEIAEEVAEALAGETAASAEDLGEDAVPGAERPSAQPDTDEPKDQE